MKNIKRYILIIATAATVAVSLSSCWNKDYYMFSDDEWSNSDFIDDRSILNGEFDLDDMDR
ncbi:MAG: hypothetical protein KBT13_12540 [Bacteroidales bacterium]|nr:hypothetical protein [Candidatus Sodaliphilus limicaballi]